MDASERNFSKKEVNRSGHFLASNSIDSTDELTLEKHLEIFNYWRGIHSYVMNIIYMNLKRRIYNNPELKDIRNAIIAQRLKRTPSILSKLNRFEKMQLSRMQDIAGVRIIVKKISDIYKIRDNINKKFPHKICSEKNYVNNPKPDGYRCLHIIFEIKGITKQKYNGLNVELQIRTELQHQWATAVEIIGLYKNTSYKSGLGDEETREFLCICSNLFARAENTPIDKRYHGKTEDELCLMLKKLNERLNILDYLRGLIVAVNRQDQISRKRNSKTCLILLKLDEKVLSLKNFTKEEDTQIAYTELEKEITKEKKNWDVVLISVNDMKKLKNAYPNYYLDSRRFVQTVQSFIDRVSNHSKP